MEEELELQKVMKNSELLRFAKNNAAIRRLVEDGVIQPLAAGYYAHPAVDPFTAYVLVVAKYYPQAVISHVTALVIHKLSDERVDQIDVDIPRTQSIRNAILTAHRVSPKQLIGITELAYAGERIRIYDMERSLCDAYKIEPVGSLFFKAVKRYVAMGEVDTEKVQLYDKTLGTNVLRALMQELADG